MEKRKRARVRNRKQRGPVSLQEKHENFIAAVRNAKCKRPPNKVKMSGTEKKKTVKRNTYNIFSIKRVTRTLLENSRCSRAEQRQRNVEKSLLHVQSCFLLIRLFFFFLFCPHRFFSITRFYILFAKTIDIKESFAFSPGKIYILD